MYNVSTPLLTKEEIWTLLNSSDNTFTLDVTDKFEIDVHSHILVPILAQEKKWQGDKRYYIGFAQRSSVKLLPDVLEFRATLTLIDVEHLAATCKTKCLLDAEATEVQWQELSVQ